MSAAAHMGAALQGVTEGVAQAGRPYKNCPGRADAKFSLDYPRKKWYPYAINRRWGAWRLGAAGGNARRMAPLWPL